MARIRSIPADFWTREPVMSVTPVARLLLLGAQTHADDYGILPGSVLSLKAQVFPADAFTLDEVRGFIVELKDQGLLEEYVVAGKSYWRITGFMTDQRPDQRSGKYPGPDGTVGATVRRGKDGYPQNDQRPFADHSENGRRTFTPGEGGGVGTGTGTGTGPGDGAGAGPSAPPAQEPLHPDSSTDEGIQKPQLPAAVPEDLQESAPDDLQDYVSEIASKFISDWNEVVQTIGRSNLKINGLDPAEITVLKVTPEHEVRLALAYIKSNAWFRDKNRPFSHRTIFQPGKFAQYAYQQTVTVEKLEKEAQAGKVAPMTTVSKPKRDEPPAAIPTVVVKEPVPDAIDLAWEAIKAVQAPSGKVKAPDRQLLELALNQSPRWTPADIARKWKDTVEEWAEVSGKAGYRNTDDLPSFSDWCKYSDCLRSFDGIKAHDQTASLVATQSTGSTQTLPSGQVVEFDEIDLD